MVKASDVKNKNETIAIIASFEITLIIANPTHQHFSISFQFKTYRNILDQYSPSVYFGHIIKAIHCFNNK
jgi:hypothetical protein